MYPWSNKIFVISFLRLDAGTSTTLWPALTEFLTLVKESAIGSVVIRIYLRMWFFDKETFTQIIFTLIVRHVICLFYQLAFLTPGISPWFAISRNFTRDTANIRIYPLGLPVRLQRLCKRTGEAFLGNFCNAS